ncbi:MAG: G5 domain-containing protein [Anaerolineae bacterium]|nr:G5 domain-containing protein [Anaerolineae bacterium]
MSDRRLPLPGTRPTSVYRPNRKPKHHKSTKREPVRFWPWLLAIALISGGIIAYRATAIPVTVIANDAPVSFSTHRQTVGGVVQAAGVRLADTVFVDPPVETPIERDMVIEVAYQQPVVVHVGGQTITGYTRESDPAAMLADLRISLNDGDTIVVTRAARVQGGGILPREIRITRPVTVIVNQLSRDGNPTQVSFDTLEPTLGEALSAAGYVFYEADRIDPPLSTSLLDLVGGEIEVTIEPSIPATVRADSLEWRIRTRGETVGDLLDELGLAPVNDDYVLPPVEVPLAAGMSVRLVRVGEEIVTEQEPIPFDTIYVANDDLELDERSTMQEGRDGTLETQISVRYEDGKEVSRSVVGEWMVERPQPEIIGYGTQIVLQEVETPDGTFTYWRHIRVLATSYSPSTADYKEPGDPFFGLTPTGVPLAKGVVATDPRVIPFFTHMYIDGYGPGQALDVGGAVKGMRIDLGYGDDDLVLWHNWVDVYLLLPVPSPDEMVWVLPE